jgi:hypothetical protein
MKHLYAMVVWCMVLILMPWYQPVHAQTTAGVDITAQVGFANSYAVMRLTPVVLTVTGDDVDRDVRLEWAITADRGTVVTWYHDITLPARSQKRIEFTTIMPGYARNIVARVRDSNGILRSTIINAEPISDLLSVVIADDTNLLAELNTATLANGAIPAVVRTVTPQAFPSTVAALHGIYTLFIADPLQLTVAQQGAIRALSQAHWQTVGVTWVRLKSTHAPMWQPQHCLMTGRPHFGCQWHVAYTMRWQYATMRRCCGSAAWAEVKSFTRYSHLMRPVDGQHRRGIGNQSSSQHTHCH